MYIDQLRVEVSPGENADELSRNYFVSKVLDNEKNGFERLNPNKNIEQRWEKIIEDEKQKVEKKVNDVDPLLAEVAWKFLKTASLDNGGIRGKIIAGWIYNEEEADSLILQTVDPRRRHPDDEEGGDTNLLIISKDSKSNNESIDDIKEEKERLQPLIEEFVLFEDIKQGKDIVLETVGRRTEEWKMKESENDFEIEIQDYLKDKTNLIVTNIEGKFSSGESSEYDAIVQPVGQYNKGYAVEVKNFEQVQDQIEEEKESININTTLKSKLITQPKDQADMMNLRLIMIVKDLEGERYQDLKKHAEQRKVILLNDENYEEELGDILTKRSIKTMNSPTHHLRRSSHHGRR